MGIILNTFKKSFAELFIEDLKASTNSYYLMISNPVNWTNETVPPSPADTTKEKLDVWNKALAAKRIETGDVRLVIPRNDWLSLKTYEQYEDTVGIDEISSENYVITSNDRVYKCIQNGHTGAERPAQSYIQPTHTTPELPPASQDGYIWQYMYSLEENDQDFVTDDWIPVQRAGSNPRVGTVENLQSEVQMNAKNGAISRVDLDASGNATIDAVIYNPTNPFEAESYKFTDVTNGSTSCTLTLKPNEELIRTNDFYVGSNKWKLYIESGVGAGELREIDGWTAGTRQLRVKPAFDTGNVPVAGSSFYSILPSINIAGNTSGGAEIVPRFDKYNGTSGGTKTITRLLINKTGRDYTYANLSLNSAVGTGLSAAATLSPIGGHGWDAPNELGAKHMMIRVKADGRENVGATQDVWPTMNDFRTFSLIKNPSLSGWTSGQVAGTQAGLSKSDTSLLTIRNTNNYATIDIHDQSFANHPTDAFSVGDFVCQGQFGPNQARGTVTSWAGGVGTPTGFLTVDVTNGQFLANDALVDGTGGYTANRIQKGFSGGDYYWGTDGGSAANQWSGFIDGVTLEGAYAYQTFTEGDIVIGENSRATAVVSNYNKDNFGEYAYLTLKNQLGTFETPSVLGNTGETIFGIRSFNTDGYFTLTESNFGHIVSSQDPKTLTRDIHRQYERLTVFYGITSGQITLPRNVSEDLDSNVIGVDSGAAGRLVNIFTTGTGPMGQTLEMGVTDLSSSFTVGEMIQYNPLFGGHTMEIKHKDRGELTPYSGEVLYIEHIKPIIRNPEQAEEFKVIIGF